MKTILVAYGTIEGHTRKIAEFIGEEIRRYGHEADVIDTASPLAAQVQPTYAGVILGGSLHQNKHPGPLVHFVKANRQWLNTIPTAFFSVSLAAVARDEKSRAEANHAAEKFLEDTGLRAGMVRLMAGALKYTEYDFLKRFIMKMIAKQMGRDTDTSHDTEYTDWDDVRRFVAEYATRARIDVREIA